MRPPTEPPKRLPFAPGRGANASEASGEAEAWIKGEAEGSKKGGWGSNGRARERCKGKEAGRKGSFRKNDRRRGRGRGAPDKDVVGKHLRKPIHDGVRDCDEGRAKSARLHAHDEPTLHTTRRHVAMPTRSAAARYA
eukprot:5334236-Pleurochrysis_carterae.AAC.6